MDERKLEIMVFFGVGALIIYVIIISMFGSSQQNPRLSGDAINLEIDSYTDVTSSPGMGTCTPSNDPYKLCEGACGDSANSCITVFDVAQKTKYCECRKWDTNLKE